MAHHWGLIVDLDRCTGCGACVVACHAENNISTVGDQQAAIGRAKHWMRVERYWEGEYPNARLRYQPVMCQQCNDAPCEPVCPTYASYHNPEGLNAQVYNRCVGTRYCANACPYNTRFFNFFNPIWEKPLDLQVNPDVSVREGEIVTACAQSCPPGALLFGDLNNPESEVAHLSNSNRASRLMEELQTRPNVIYLKQESWHDGKIS